MYLASFFKSAGTHSGIVGTWEVAGYDSTEQYPYTWDDETFSSDGTITYSSYESATGTKPSEAYQTDSSKTYTLGNDGTISITHYDSVLGAYTTQKAYYKIVGSYLIFGNESSIDNDAAFIKQ